MIYVLAEIEHDGTTSPYVKVGSVKPDEPAKAEYAMRQRLSMLQVGNPRQVAIIALGPGGQVQEKEMHRHFERHRLRRPIVCEWMRRAPEVDEWIASLTQVRIEIKRRVAKEVPPKRKPACEHCGAPGHVRWRCLEYRALMKVKAIELRSERLERERLQRQAIARAKLPTRHGRKTFEWRGQWRDE